MSSLARDLAGETFGRLTVLGRAKKPLHWRCVCACGKRCTIDGRSMVAGKTKSCGCLRREVNAAKTKRVKGKDIQGQRFDQLVALRVAPIEPGQRGTQWVCACDCGKEIVVGGADLRAGRRRSCGCLRRRPRRDLVGQTFGFLTVEAWAPSDSGRGAWQCRCACGKRVTRVTITLSDKAACAKACPATKNKYLVFGVELTTWQMAALAGAPRDTIRIRLKAGMSPENAAVKIVRQGKRVDLQGDSNE